MQRWEYSVPNFECDKYNLEMMKYSPWSGHRFFGYDYVKNENPKVIVELGSYYGCSAFTFLQAIKDNSYDSDFFSVDTWLGDSFTNHDYQEDIFGSFKSIVDNCFYGQNVHILRKTFDQAADSFPENSIDLLHIDGSHLYQDVKHDFKKWKSKVKKDGVIFFHDISDDELFGEKLGSHIFWEELKEEYSFNLEFLFSFGLGILCFDKKVFEHLKNEIDFSYYQKIVNQSDVQNKDLIRKSYFEIKDLRKYNNSLKTQNEILNNHLEKYSEDVNEKNKYIQLLEDRNKGINELCKRTFEESQEAISNYQNDIELLKNESKKTIDLYERDSNKKNRYIKELEVKVGELSSLVKNNFDETQKLSRCIEEKNNYIDELKNSLVAYDSNLVGKDNYINQLTLDIQKINYSLSEKDKYISELQKGLNNFEKDAQVKKEYILNLENAVEKYKYELCGKNSYIHELENTIELYKGNVAGKEKYISELNHTIHLYENNAKGKERYIEELKETISLYEENVKGKEGYIEELKETIFSYEENVKGKDDYISELFDQLEKYKLLEENLSKSIIGRRLLEKWSQL